MILSDLQEFSFLVWRILLDFKDFLKGFFMNLKIFFKDFPVIRRSFIFMKDFLLSDKAFLC